MQSNSGSCNGRRERKVKGVDRTFSDLEVKAKRENRRIEQMKEAGHLGVTLSLGGSGRIPK